MSQPWGWVPTAELAEDNEFLDLSDEAQHFLLRLWAFAAAADRHGIFQTSTRQLRRLMALEWSLDRVEDVWNVVRATRWIVEYEYDGQGFAVFRRFDHVGPPGNVRKRGAPRHVVPVDAAGRAEYTGSYRAGGKARQLVSVYTSPPVRPGVTHGPTTGAPGPTTVHHGPTTVRPGPTEDTPRSDHGPTEDDHGPTGIDGSAEDHTSEGDGPTTVHHGPTEVDHGPPTVHHGPAMEGEGREGKGKREREREREKPEPKRASAPALGAPQPRTTAGPEPVENPGVTCGKPVENPPPQGAQNGRDEGCEPVENFDPPSQVAEITWEDLEAFPEQAREPLMRWFTRLQEKRIASWSVPFRRPNLPHPLDMLPTLSGFLEDFGAEAFVDGIENHLDQGGRAFNGTTTGPTSYLMGAMRRVADDKSHPMQQGRL